MSETTSGTTAQPSVAKSRKVLKREGRQKRVAKLRTNLEFAKTYFEAKSKRSQDKSASFRKKKKNKK